MTSSTHTPRSFSPTLRRAATWTLHATALAWTVTQLMGCACSLCEDDEADKVREENEAIQAAYAACPTLAQVQDDFGATLGGVYGDAALIEYRIAQDDSGRVTVSPPNGSPCAQEIANRLVQACDLCDRQPGQCVNLVTQILELPGPSCAACGDATCSPGETNASCPDDCRCGNGQCEIALAEPETARTCPEDCAGACGDDYCAAPIEACECPPDAEDCIPCIDCCKVICGDGQCDLEGGENNPEDALYCEVDCGKGACGDGVCNPLESSATCPLDCGGLDCGDGICRSPETCQNCPEDCGHDRAACLDGVCSVCEFWTCQADCEEIEFNCGDGICEGFENPANCIQDCGWSPSSCGDGVCSQQQGEYAANCREDCNIDLSEERCGDEVCNLGDELNGCAECQGCPTGNTFTCVTSGRTCVQIGSSELIYDCSAPDACGRPDEIECGQGLCTYDAQGEPMCTTCPRPAPGVEVTLCPGNFEPRCVGPTTLQTCGLDPRYTPIESCEVIVSVPCDGRCVDGACTLEPVVTVLNPAMGLEGDAVVIAGVGFGPSQGAVTFAGAGEARLEATITRWSESDIIAIAPPGVVTGPVEISGETGSAPAGVFTVVEDAQITRVVPESGRPGDLIRVDGVGFGEIPGALTMAPGVEPVLVGWEPRAIRFLVPGEAQTGPITITTSGGEVLTVEQFSVLSGEAPIIRDVQPREARPGDRVTITGQNFGRGGAVVFNPNSPARAIVSWSDDQIVAVVPDYAIDGPVRVQTQFAVRSSNVQLRILPTIFRFETCRGVGSARLGDTVTIHGVGFGNNSTGRITFSPELEVLPRGWTSTRVEAVVPDGAETGPVTLTVIDRETDMVTGEVTSDEALIIEEEEANPWVQAQWPMPDTSVTLCSDGESHTPCPAEGEPFYGQDGTIQRPTPEYVVTDATVTDPITGLEWQRALSSSAVAGDEASCVCGGLRLGGHDDWRLPTVIELLSLVEPGRREGLDPEIWPNAINRIFWSAELQVSGLGSRWTVSNVGDVVFTNVNAEYFIRCVRSDAVPAQPTPAYVVTEETVTDPLTGYQWQRANSALMDWPTAITTCEELELAGFDDWHLPSYKDLYTLVDLSRSEPAIDTDAFPDVPTEPTWTSTPVARLGNAAYTVLWSLGFGGVRITNTQARARCVRYP